MKTHIRLTKVTRLPDRPNGDLITAEAPSQFGAIVEGYTIRGHYTEPPTIGKHFHVDRYERNGIKIESEFSTSPVWDVEIKGNKTAITTQNSIYLMETIEE